MNALSLLRKGNFVREKPLKYYLVKYSTVHTYSVVVGIKGLNNYVGDVFVDNRDSLLTRFLT